ncbi:hypothetical protein [uncultured Desulfobacter sp.]|uniref:hypothetical protein n=1 Tax=uncultured Desulfobacter sp. TaxID=240139 RepID=UPI002AAB5684|nr:hypothetical protein [uncultured Desulfobacter sp.]
MDSSLSMLRYYKKHLYRLKDMLDGIDPTNDDFEPLLELQDYIVERILDTERRLKKKKTALKELKKLLKSKSNRKENANIIKSKIKKANDSISGYKYLLYVWRCFGDGIAFKYVSKWNLKRFLFESDTPAIKQTAGHIGGKAGLKVEWHLVKNAAINKVPAILCDITNSIRHGDVCLLGASDPFVIEVKSSKNTNKRINRQMKAIDSIHSYLKNDQGPIGGVECMRRVNIPIEERNHNEAFNKVVNAARKGEILKISPEPGLFYLGFKTGSNPNYDKLLNDISEPVIYLLNQAKTEKRWDNYYPFTLSINNRESLYAFLNGDVYLMVIVDGSILKSMSTKIGYDLDIVLSEEAGFVFSKKLEGYDEPFIGIIPDQYIGRIGLEFMSLSWFFQNEKKLLAGLEEEFYKKIGKV